jgi:hypothetical protein
MVSALSGAAPSAAAGIRSPLGTVERILIPLAGCWLLALTVWGFAGTLRLIPNPLGLPLLIKVHGVGSFAWVVLFALQAAMAASGRRTLHRRLGIAALISLAVTLPTGYATVIRAMALDRRTPAEGVLLLLTLTIALIYVVAAFLARRRSPAFHARAMLFATVFLTSLAIDRVSFLAGFVDRWWLVTAVRVIPCAAVAAADMICRRGCVWFDDLTIVLLAGIDMAATALAAA